MDTRSEAPNAASQNPIGFHNYGGESPTLSKSQKPQL